MKRIPTGLMKVCPRCGREGIVWASPEQRWFEIDWPARVTGKIGTHRADPARHDTALDMDDLIRPTMGCGYDDRQTEAA